QALPRVRCAQRPRTLVRTARGTGKLEPDDVPWQERQAIRRGGRRRHADRVRATVMRAPAKAVLGLFAALGTALVLFATSAPAQDGDLRRSGPPEAEFHFA